MADMPSSGDDGEIINNTIQNRNEKGHVQFETTLPSGRKVTSEWLNEDQVKRALAPWLDAIKGQIALDKEEFEAERRRAAAKIPKRKSALLDSSGNALAVEEGLLPVEDLTDTASAIPTNAVLTSPLASTASGLVRSPEEFIRQGIAQAQKDVNYWSNEANKAANKWQESQDNLRKWESMLAAMSGGVQKREEIVSSPSPRRGRPAGSRNKPKLPTGRTSDTGEV